MDKIEVLKTLTQVYVPPSNFMVQPHIGIFKEAAGFERQESEVAALIEVPLTDFMDDSKIIKENLSTSYAKNITVPAFKLNGYVVWGATAMMLNEIKDIFRRVL